MVQAKIILYNFLFLVIIRFVIGNLQVTFYNLIIGENMAIDFDAIRKKLDRLSGNNRTRNVMWRPTEGEELTVRLISFPKKISIGMS